MSRRRKALGTLSAIGAWLVCLAGPQAGLAEVSCERSADGAVLAISATDGYRAVVRRAGDAIKVFDRSDPARGCKAGATVRNIDQIELFAAYDAAVDIELSGGPFAPGLTPEEDGSPEIEFTLSGDGSVIADGGPGPDRFRFTGSGPEGGVNLNPAEDEDVDVFVSPDSRRGLIFVVNGGGGADRIDGPALEKFAVAATGMFAVGGTGNDTLVAPARGAILFGGSGSDRLIGSPIEDSIRPGRGADLVRAGGGFDEVTLNRDGVRDRIDCGPGLGHLVGSDRFDRLSSCRVAAGLDAHPPTVTVTGRALAL